MVEDRTSVVDVGTCIFYVHVHLQIHGGGAKDANLDLISFKYFLEKLIVNSRLVPTALVWAPSVLEILDLPLMLPASNSISKSASQGIFLIMHVRCVIPQYQGHTRPQYIRPLLGHSHQFIDRHQ